jgi:pimeloyl-ACP methyl ester carboxylesterase
MSAQRAGEVEQSEQPQELWHRVGGAWVRALDFGDAPSARATVVLVPGLALPRYTHRTATALTRLGLRCLVLDVLAGPRAERRVPPRILPMGAAVAAWADQAGLQGPLVLVGHSTGAQVVVAAAHRLQDTRASLSVLLAGLTFQPAHRSVSGLLRAAATAYRRDSPRELVTLKNLVSVRGDLVRLVDSARRDSPELRIAGLRAPLMLTAGEADTFAPEQWMRQVAAASENPLARVTTLPGSHNNLWTHPEEFAALVGEMVQEDPAL